MTADDTLSVEYGGQAPPAPGGGDGVLDWYRWWCGQSPTAPAVEQAGAVWTYADLDTLADEVADRLHARIRPGDVVGVCLDRSAALVALTVAIAKLGAVYLPLGPQVGRQRLDTVLATLRVRCLVDQQGRLPESHAQDRISLALLAGGDADSYAVDAGFADPADTTAAAAPEGAFYAVLTSGTTGGPKIIVTGARSLAGVVRWYCRHVGLRAGERHSLVFNPAFDGHVLELWSTLCSGTTLSVAPPEIRWDPQAMIDWWSQAGITVGFLPTPLAEAVLERPWPARLGLRHLVIGGDRLRLWPPAGVTAQVHNAYGPAEATVVTTACSLGAEPSGEGQPPIGRPIPGAIICVTDEAGRVVPRGQPGELRIGGAGLALRCLNDSQAERFAAPPDGLTGAHPFYRSGDRVRMRIDGMVEFLGRLDDQLKVRGVRIEPTEVEMALERDPAVQRAVVVARPTGDGTTQLEAFIQPDPGNAPAEDQLLAAVRAWLPEQAVPAAVHTIESIPLTANGKIDRSALLASVPPAADSDELPDGPVLTSHEHLVLDVCRRLLGRPQTVLADRFIDIGGDSLKVAKLLASLENATGIRLRAAALLRQPDLRSIAALLHADEMTRSRSQPISS